MSDPQTTIPPLLTEAKRVLDEVLAIKEQNALIDDFSQEARDEYQKFYHKCMMIIYLSLTNTAMEARSERH